MNPLALYLHFPYCLYKCHYCDFNSYAVETVADLERPYEQALLREWERAVQSLKAFEIGSVFLGGGTPSLFSSHSIGRILKLLSPFFSKEGGVEISLEANPKSLDEEKIAAYLRAGVNRFSVGIQSFKNKYLSPLGRLHTGEEAEAVLQLFQNLRVENFNLDLMFGFPDQGVQEVLEDLEQALPYASPHLSFYQLTLEKNTRLYEAFRKGSLKLPEMETQTQMMQEGMGRLEEAGYQRYEVSNFCRDNKKSIHNLAYWRYQPYLGLGAGAVSFLPCSYLSESVQDPKHQAIPAEPYGWRWTGPLTPKAYLSWAGEALLPQNTLERIDGKTARGEFWMMGLRLAEGVNREEYERRFASSLFRDYGQRISLYQDRGWLEVEGAEVRATPQGFLFLNEMVLDFLED